MNNKNDLRMMLREALDNMWSRIRSLFGGLDDRVTALEQGGGTPGPQGPKGDKGDTGATGPQGPKGDPGDPATNLITSVNGKTGAVVLNAADVGAIPSTQKGVAGGVAELDSGGKVPSTQLPSYVDDVLEYASQSAFPATGEAGKIYVATDTNITYRWSGSAYVEISPSLALGETSSTAYRGDRGKAAYDHAQAKGSAFASGLYKIQTNAEGHVTGATAVQKSDITALGIPGQDTTYSAATTTAPGLMSATDKAKLDDANACAKVGPSTMASFSDAIAANALNLSVDIEPVQDLHGYDHPWPAGGGENKLPPMKVAGQYTDVTISVSGETYTLNGNPNAYGQAIANNSFALPAGTYYLKTFTVSGTGNAYPQIRSTDGLTVYATTATPTFTLTESTELKARFTWDANFHASNLVVRLMIATGTTEPTAWTPYSNICPISGRTGANVTRCGKNFVEIDNAWIGSSETNNGITWRFNEDGSMTLNGTKTATTGNIVIWNFANAALRANPQSDNKKHIPNGDYYIYSGHEKATLQVYGSNDENAGISNSYYITSGNLNPVRFTINDTYKYNWIRLNIAGSAVFDNYTFYPMVRLASDTGAEQAPYTGATYDIPFPASAGTVYGGTLDVTTGLLTVTYGNIASYAGETLPGAWISSMDVYTAGGTPTTGAQVVYELANPITYQLTPTQIALLGGANNVWADCGDATVGYLRADSLCINRAIAARLKDGGDVNVIESISVNGTNILPDANKNVNLTVPEDVGFYVDAQGYLCQRIRSDT